MARHRKRPIVASRGGMDANDRGANINRYFLLYLRRNQAVGASSLQYNRADPGSVGYGLQSFGCQMLFAERGQAPSQTGMCPRNTPQSITLIIKGIAEIKYNVETRNGADCKTCLNQMK